MEVDGGAVLNGFGGREDFEGDVDDLDAAEDARRREDFAAGEVRDVQAGEVEGDTGAGGGAGSGAAVDLDGAQACGFAAGIDHELRCGEERGGAEGAGDDRAVALERKGTIEGDAG
ncbi:hypothetical protein WDZ92_47215, partial [Nostoc sp. NIES-2111]